MRLEEYGFIGDLHTGALVGSNGSIDWLCLPRFDSAASFAALLGTAENGFWQVTPQVPCTRSTQRYRPETLILETLFETPAGTVRLIDFMPPGDHRHDVMRIAEGVSGCVPMEMTLSIRFDYGRSIPWVQREDGGIRAIAGPEALTLHTEIETFGQDLTTRARFDVRPGDRRTFALTWFTSTDPDPAPLAVEASLQRTETFWRDWCAHCTVSGPHRDAIMRSLITLKALTYEPTGGIIAAATTSLPEQLGGVRNWDYRFCWLRDATFTLYSLLNSGYTTEAQAWGDWLVRAVAGDPGQLQMLYGAAGERHLPELELPHLLGYENSRPVRIGNAAAQQFQLDVYGEVLDSAHLKRERGLPTSVQEWHVQRHLVEYVIEHWREPDEGIWEMRGPRQHFTHSKVMAWVALDRAVKAVEHHGLEGDLPRWRSVRDDIHATVCEKGYHAASGVFTQHYDSPELDASLLMMPLVGFLPATDPRVTRTIRAIQDQLAEDGLIRRYRTEKCTQVDGLPPGEGVFLPCSFWLVDCLVLLGAQAEAEALFDRLLHLRTPLGLLAEEYDVQAKRLVGNFPQAFSHVGLIGAAQSIARGKQSGGLTPPRG